VAGAVVSRERSVAECDFWVNFFQEESSLNALRPISSACQSGVSEDDWEIPLKMVTQSQAHVTGRHVEE